MRENIIKSKSFAVCPIRIVNLINFMNESKDLYCQNNF